MKATLVVVVLLLAASAVYADTIDPGIIIGGGVGSFGVPSTPFSFAQGSGSNCVYLGPGSGAPGPNPGPCIFLNQSGVVWTNLTIFVTTTTNLTLANLSCGIGSTPFFSGCSITQLGPNSFQFFFFGGTGWLIGGDEMINIFAFGRWPDQGQTFQAIANIPEPATMLLTATGLASFFLRRRLRKS